MTRRVYKAVCTASLGVFVVTMLLIMGALYDYFSSLQRDQLRVETNLAARAVELEGQRFFENLEMEDFRITWIGSGGEVLFDSVSDSESMENHLEREEIRQALMSGFGESSRYSDTLMKQYLYAARKLADGTVLRLSVSHNTTFVLLFGMLQPILMVVFVALVLSFLMASSLSRRIVEPLNRLNLDEPLKNEGYEELSPLLRRIHSQQQQLKRQQTNLTQKQNELDAIVANLAEGMILLDRSGYILTVNQAARTMLDAHRGKVDGASLLALSRNQSLQEAVREAMEGKTSSKKTVLRGRTIQIQAAAVGEEKEMSGVAVVLFDITQMEQAEQRRREFTANVSHELKTPMQSISGYSELMQCGMIRPEDVQPFAGRIYTEAQRLIHLVEDIINLSHLDENGSYEWQQLDLYREAENIIENQKPIGEEKGVTLHLTGRAAPMRGIPELVRGIMNNLCDNAIKYNRPGGSVTMTVSDGWTETVLTVADTGIGIPEEDIDRIFERFYRVDKSRSKEVGGTGLGLSIVKHAAMLHNAKIEVESRLGQGTTFTVRFPK